MKKPFLLFLFSIIFIKFSAAQILCVQCFEQNDSIGLVTPANNLIVNGGFENTTCGFYPFNEVFCPNAQFYTCDILNWICTGGGSNTYAKFDTNNIYVEEGTRSPYFGNSFCKACSTTQFDTSCINFSGCTVTGIPLGYPDNTNPGYGGIAGLSLSQAVIGLVIGNTYILEFWAGGEGNGVSFINKGLFAVDMGFGNTFLRNKPTPAHTGVGTRFLIQFKATSSSHTITFTNWGHICSDCTELVLDDVRLYTPQYLPSTINVCTEVGINQPSENTITISPNPFSKELNVITNHPSTIIIYDLLSRKLLSQTFINTITLNTEFLAKGIYMYEVRTDKGSEKGKLIKE